MPSDKTSRLKRKLLQDQEARKALRRATKGRKLKVTVDGQSYSVEQIDVFDRARPDDADNS